MIRTKLTMPLLVLLAATAFGLWATALAQDDDPVLDALIESVTFKPIDEIVDDALIVTNFASDGSATLPIETSVPVACSIVYGTTTEFGSLSVDQDMDGGTHSEHNPLLTGLAPETTYYFRVQGVDDAGVIYLSDVMTFTTPPQSTEEVTNLASPELGAEIVGYSSAFRDADIDETWGAGSAFDGSPNSAWSSAGDGDDAWIEVRLAQRSRVDRVAFWSRSMTDGTAQVYEFTVTTDTGETYGPFTLPDAAQSYEFEVSFEAETLRFDLIRSSGGNTGAVDIGVFGEPLDD